MDRKKAIALQKQRYYDSLIELRNQLNHLKPDPYGGQRKVFMVCWLDSEIAETIVSLMSANELSFSQVIETQFLADAVKKYEVKAQPTQPLEKKGEQGL